MKGFSILFFFILVLAPTIVAQDNGYYYWYNDESMPIKPKIDKWFVLLDYAPDPEYLAQALSIGEDRIGELQKVHNKNRGTTHSTSHLPFDTYWTIVSGRQEEWDSYANGILYNAPFFYSQSGIVVGLSHLFYVKLNQPEDIEFLKELALIHRVDIVGSSRLRPAWYTLACNRESSGNALEMANLFYETGFFSAAEPDFMKNYSLQSVNDPYFSDQWGLKNTGQYGGNSGSDIKALNAWAITEGKSDIIIAIVDEGLEMDHPDLPNIHLDSYDAYDDTSPSLIWGNHGTPVAGIAGARTNNNEGIAGIATNSMLMSISHPLIFSIDAISELANAITFAWQNGAHIINNSWGHDDYQSQILDDAIADAVVYGRDGLGSVVVAASGNLGDNTIMYPSSHPDAIAVGASNMCDERKSQSSCDGENWGSNYGTGLDIVAPGVLIPTTDLQGGLAGYNPGIPIHPILYGNKINSDYANEDYTIWFTGTSAAAPHVSGVAALILAINSELTAMQVRQILRQSADKVGGYTYDGVGWNDEMGYGRLNAYKALVYTVENYGATMGIEKSIVRLHLEEDISFYKNVHLAGGSTLTIEALETVTLSAASGTVTIGAPPPSAKVVEGGQGLVRAGLPHTDPEPETRPEQFLLLPNYPNPFNPSTTIRFELPIISDVRLEVYDMLGRRVALLMNETRQAGTHQAVFNASALSSGVYIYRLQAGGLVQTRKMLLIR